MSDQFYDIEDAKFYELTDPGDECNGGSAPVYADGIDIGCVKSINLTENRNEAEQTGDAGVCAKVNRTKDYSGTLQHGGLNPTLLEKLIGATRTTHTSAGGVNATRVAVNQDDVKARGAIIAKLDTPGLDGTMHIIFWNVEISSKPDVNAAEGAFFNTQLNLSLARSLYAAHNCKGWHDLISFDDLVEIPTVFPGTTDYPA